MTDDAAPGYKRPPEATRFKSGESGNPRGRPKGSRNLKTDLTMLLNKRITVRENGEVRQISRQEAMLLGLYSKALGGDTKASNQLLSILVKLGIQDAAPTQPEVVTDNDRAIVEDFLRRNSAATKGEII
jgi:hypothetical protein